MEKSGRLHQELLLVPSPARLRRTGGWLTLPAAASLFEETPSSFSTTIRETLSIRSAREAAASTVRLLSPASAPRDLIAWTANAEGYAMRIGQDGIRIWASTGAGHLYGAMTLLQLLRQYGRRLPGLVIGDRPALSRRGIQLSFPQGHTAYRDAYMRRLVPQLARWKINELYLYLESFFDFPSLPHMAGLGAMTPSQAKSLDRLCLAYNIKLIPMLNTLAHCGEILATQRYQHLSEYPPSDDPRLVRPFNLCAGSKEVDALVDGMLNDLCACFSADTVHVGGDEVSCIGQCPRCRPSGKKTTPLSLYVRYFERILNTLARHGRRGGLWGDMLLHDAPAMSKREQARLLQPFRDKAVIYDWSYSGGSRKTLDFFVQSGIETIAASSTNLCYASALWPAQAVDQRALFQDAIDAGARGGMTTAWTNWTGLHEEQFNYLHASGAAILWSGTKPNRLAGNLTFDRFESAYSLHRYGIRSTVLADYLHALGDANGPVLNVLKPLHGVELRKSLYHTDNPLLFWARYCKILSDGGVERYQDGLVQARGLWNRLQREPAATRDPDFRFLAGPLLMHEHLLARYEATERAYRFYDQAARAQYRNPVRFRALLEKAASSIERHLRDFTPIEEYLAQGRAALGFDLSTLNRIRATQGQVRYLAAFFRHLKASHRPLPSFGQLHQFFLERFRTHWYGDREHDWAAESPRFQRYSLTVPDAWTAVAGDAAKEWRRMPRRGK